MQTACRQVAGEKYVEPEVVSVCLWSFIFKKEKRVESGDDPNFGDAYCFVVIERHSKLVLNLALGKRDKATTECDKHGLQPTVFYRWQKEFFENGTSAFQPKGRPNHRRAGFVKDVEARSPGKPVAPDEVD